jgi:hypothetical protein
LLDRSLVIVGLVFTSITSLLVGLAPSNQPSEVATVQLTPFVTAVALEVVNAKEILPEQQAVPKGIPRDKTKRCPQWEAKFREYGLPVVAFSYISWRESRCSVSAHNTTLNRNKTHDIGLVQINSSWRTVTRDICGTDITGLFDVDCNLSVARYLYDNGGLGHWSL